MTRERVKKIELYYINSDKLKEARDKAKGINDNLEKLGTNQSRCSADYQGQTPTLPQTEQQKDDKETNDTKTEKSDEENKSNHSANDKSEPAPELGTPTLDTNEAKNQESKKDQPQGSQKKVSLKLPIHDKYDKCEPSPLNCKTLGGEGSSYNNDSVGFGDDTLKAEGEISPKIDQKNSKADFGNFYSIPNDRSMA